MAKFGKKQPTEIDMIMENMNQAERILQDKIYQLGQMYYMDNCEKTDLDPKYKEMIDLITRLEANRMAIYQNKLRLEGKMVCESCGEVIPYGSVFCSVCGKQATSQPVVQPVAPAYMPAGTPQVAPVQPATPVYAPVAEPAPVVNPVPVETPAQNVAPTPVVNVMPAVEPDPEVVKAFGNAAPAAPATASVCHACGTPLEPDSVFCANCGSKVK